MAMAKPWNPMADAYGNREFNNYQQGPGANLDDSHQPGAMANPGTNRSPYRLCLKNVPKDMNTQGIQNLCSSFGKVTGIHTSQRTPFIFVSFATLNDMERVLTGLKDNPHGITADIAKDSKKFPYSGSENGKDENKNPASSYLNMPLPSEVDMTKRSIKGPFTNPQRSHPFRRQPIVTRNDHENSELNNVDADKHFLINHDLYDGDRDKPKQEQSTRGKLMRTGRPYHTETKEAADRIKKLSESSKGSYDPQKNEYVNESNVSINGNVLGDCVRCSKPANKFCQRCEDFYCSFECQKNDWPNHRYICFKMPQLLSSHSNNIEVPLPETTQNLPNASNTPNQNKPNQNKQNPSQIKGDLRRQQIQNLQAVANKANHPPQNNQNPQTTAKGPQQKPQNAAPPKAPEPKPKAPEPKPKAPEPKPKAPEPKPKAPEPKPKAPEPKPKPTVKGVDPPPSGCTVAITTISKTNSVYIRSLAHEDNVEYIKILNIINTHARKCKVVEKLPERGDILIADFQDTGYYRVLVVNNQNKDKILVAYVDFGNVDTKKLSELRELPEEAYNCPRYTIPVNLKGVEDFQPPEEILTYMNSFADISGREVKMIYDNIKDGVELIDLSTNDNINKKIVNMLKVEIPKDDDAPVMATGIEMKLIPDGENIPVYVFDNSFLQTGCISCIHESDILTLEGFSKQIQEYAEKTTETYTPREQEMCLVKYEEDGLWYRAECMEVVGDGHPSVLFIDYGNVSLAKIENIRKFPKELAYPCFTSTCLIQDLPQELNNKTVERLTELIPMNEKLVLEKVVGVVESEINQVNIPKVINILKAENLI